MEKARYVRLDPLRKYSSQVRAMLSETTCAVIGVGALGSSVARLAGAIGFGKLILIDRDIVTVENLGTSSNFTEDMLRTQTFKAEAVADAITKQNSKIRVTVHTQALSEKNAEEILGGVDIILDGLDNFRTRFLVNEVAVKLRKAYIYAGTAGENGVVMPIIPAQGPCLRCLIPIIPQVGEAPSCSEVGMDPAIVQMIAAVEVDIAVRLVADIENFQVQLYRLNAENLKVDIIPAPERNLDCPVCAMAEFKFLSGGYSPSVENICGADALQVVIRDSKIEIDRIEKVLKKNGFSVQKNPFFIRATGENGVEYTIFPQGKVVMKGSTNFEQLDSFLSSCLGV